MKISYQSLKEFVNFEISVQELSEELISLGLGVASIQPCPGGEDFILDAEITSNRGDCLSIIGIAREISAKLGRPLKISGAKICENDQKIENFLKVEIEDEILCPRYNARMIRDVKVGPSPSWMSKRLESLGVRSVNNVVDATNYVLLERGQPLHAFDYSLIKGQKIIVRRAKLDEKLITLDGIERKLNNNMLVIADAERPIALAGVMGGANTEVNNSTKDVVIESACFNAGNIRKTSQVLGLGTSASYRFERSSDIEESRISVDRVCALIQEIAGGTILKGVIDEYPSKQKTRKIKVRFPRINYVLGMNFQKKEVIQILKRLGFNTKTSKNFLTAEVPSWRHADVTGETDIIEECARLHGYDNIKSELPALNFEDSSKYSSVGSGTLTLQDEAREAMRDAGFFESVNYGIIKRSVFEKVFSQSVDLIRINNPLDEEMDILRPSLIPGLVENLAFNFNRDIDSIKIFEIGRIFKKSGERLPQEQIMLSGLLSGDVQKYWADQHRTLNFYDLKGALEYLFERLGIDCFSFKPGKNILMDAGVKILMKNKEVGFAGRMKSEIAQFYKLLQEVFLFEIELENMKDFRIAEKRYKSVPR